MNQVLPYCVYVLLSEKDGMFYIGYTTDIDRRYKEHNDGKSKSTAPRRPFQLIFCEFMYLSLMQRDESYILKLQQDVVH